MTHETNAHVPASAAGLSPTTPRHAAYVGEQQLGALTDLLAGLDPREWDNDTDCTGWSVRDIVAHVTGSCEESVRPWVFFRHSRAATRRYGDRAWLDGLNEAQIDDRRDLPPGQLLDDLRRLAPAAVRARRRLPRLLRARAMPDNGALPAGSTVGYLMDVILPRDAWMHRIDIARATGRTPAPTDADAEVVGQVVLDVAHAWTGPAFTLTLAGHGGGSWRIGTGSPDAHLRADTVEACRMLSGRQVTGRVVEHDGRPAVADRFTQLRIAF